LINFQFEVEEPKEEEPPVKVLEDLFRKTNSTPYIYWLPLTDEQVNNFE
jgi:apoptotic chromatin condensation inducer in the nucleus